MGAQEGRPVPVYGALIGKQNGRDIELMNSFELDYNMIEGCVVIDRDYYNTKEEQFKQVFSDMDFLGWYSTGDHPSKIDADVHKQNSDIPLTMYESLIDIVKGEAKMVFVKLNYSLAT